jgi:TPR repeat protein
MIICNNCKNEEAYTGAVCSVCGKPFSITKEDRDEFVLRLEESIKNREYEDMLECYHILADFGYTPAQREYAKILEKGQLAPRNLDAAMGYFYKAAQKNDAYSAFRYSRLAGRTNDTVARFWLIFSAILGCKEAYPAVAEAFSSSGYEEDANYFYWLAATCDDVESIVTLAKRYYNGIGVEQSQEYAKWYMDKLTIPPIYAIKLAYKLRGIKAKEAPKITLKNYNGLIHGLSIQARNCGFDTAYIKLLEILSEQGDYESTALVGEALVNGVGCEQNVNEGLHLLNKAAAAKNVYALLTLGNLYSPMGGMLNNPNLAIDYYTKAGALGSHEAYKAVGDIFYTGSGVDRNIAAAVEFYELAAEAGSTEADKKAKGIKQERDGLYASAVASESSDPNKAFRMYAIACAMGHTGAMLRLAACYEKGIGTKKSRHGAFIWYSEAAKLGERDALLPLGICYAKGMGTKLDYDKAREYLTKAERIGSEQAHKEILRIMNKKMAKISKRIYSTSMRLIYQKKFKTAKNYLEIAADLMYPKAIYTLGCLYEFGIGAKCDKELAFNLYEKAYSLFFRDPRSEYKLNVLRMLKLSLI